MTCGYGIAWQPPCDNPSTEPGGRCIIHDGRLCISCGEHSTHECDFSAQFVCGAPLCDRCRHDSGSGHHPIADPEPLPTIPCSRCDREQPLTRADSISILDGWEFSLDTGWLCPTDATTRPRPRSAGIIRNRRHGA